MAIKKNVSSKKSVSNGVGKKGMSGGAKVALVSAGVIAAGAAAYFLSNKKRRAKAKTWMIKMKDESVKKLGAMGSMSKEMYHEAIDKIAEKYENVKDASPAEIAGIVTEMKKYWANIKKPIKKAAAKKVVNKAKRAIKKVAKN